MATIIRGSSVDNYWNYNAVLPYGLKTEEIRKAVEDIYNFFYRVNSLLVEQEGLTFFEQLVLGNSLSGMMSELLVKRIAAHSSTVERNIRIGGHPDLIPKGMYDLGSILRGEEGIEVKTSKQPGGWQAHNPEKCWLMVFRYIMEKNVSKPAADTQPITFVQILGAPLDQEDWSLAERGEASRRTRTVSINQKGMHKLRSNPIYHDSKYVVAPSSELRRHYTALNNNFKKEGFE